MYYREVLSLIGLPPSLAVSMCPSPFGRLHCCHSPSLSISSLVFFLLFSFILCLRVLSLSLLTTSPSASSPTFSTHFATLCWLQGWKQTRQTSKLLAENTPLCFLGIVFPESLCLKCCFGLCLDGSTVYSSNNPLEFCLFGSSDIRPGYINSRVSTLHYVFRASTGWRQVVSEEWLFMARSYFQFSAMEWFKERCEGAALAALWSVNFSLTKSMLMPHVLLSRKKLVLLKHWWKYQMKVYWRDECPLNTQSGG